MVVLVRREREVVDGADDLVPQLLVEERRLEAEGIEEELVAAPGRGLPFRRFEQARAIALASEQTADPQVLDLAGPRPGPAVEPRRNDTVVVAHEDAQPLAVGRPGLLDVVFVELVLEKSAIGGGRLGFDQEGRHPLTSLGKVITILCLRRMVVEDTACFKRGERPSLSQPS